METQNNLNDNQAPIENPQVTLSGNGALVGAIIVIILIALLGVYFFIGRESESLAPDEILNQKDTVLEQIPVNTAADTISSIEEDLAATPLSNLDTELEEIESELKDAF